MHIKQALAVLDLLVEAYQTGGDMAQKLRDARNFVADMSRQERNPTQREWDKLHERMQVAGDTLEKRAEEARKLL